MRSLRKTRIVTFVAAIAFLAFATADAAIVTVPLVDPASGDDSGWSASYDNSYIDISVDQVNLESNYLLIQISKEFTLGPNPFTGQFPALPIDFIQRLPDAQTVSMIRVNDELIRNLTGVPWTDFHWQLFDSGDVWFDVGLSGAFGIQPSPQFQTQIWHLLDGDGMADGIQTSPMVHANALTVIDGIVAIGENYYPGIDDSDLVMEVNLGGEPYVTFTFKQYPTPEPATVALMGLGLVLVGLKKGKKAGSA